MKALVDGEAYYAQSLTEGERKRDFLCPVCKESFIAVIPVSGIIKHFRHRSGQTHGGEPETETHVLMKQWVKDEAEKLGLECELEVHVVIDSKLHIADALIQGPEGKIVVECQCSSISVKDYRERTEFYQDNDYQIIWILGGKLEKKYGKISNRMIYDFFNEFRFGQNRIVDSNYNTQYVGENKIWDIDENQISLREMITLTDPVQLNHKRYYLDYHHYHTNRRGVIIFDLDRISQNYFGGIDSTMFYDAIGSPRSNVMKKRSRLISDWRRNWGYKGAFTTPIKYLESE